ncbi:MAG: RNA polymerase sigma factor [Bradyrhizobiaceae bacterium]|nr:RNA polymerase sigma factor [Bradyrhizobiaceae bacterium]
MRTLSEYTDVELFGLFTTDQGEAAFGELYARYSSVVYAYCMRVMGDREQAHDVFQDTFMKFYQAASRHEQLENVKGYLLTISRNLCFNEKKRNNNRTLEFDELLYNPGESRDADQNEMLQLVRVSLELLPQDMREAFVLREYQGLSYTEIAKVIGMTVPTAKVRVFRARQKLKEILQPYLDEQTRG